jgi:hypothetical protein
VEEEPDHEDPIPPMAGACDDEAFVQARSVEIPFGFGLLKT